MAENKPILFFDGHCNLCNGFIDFLVRRKATEHFFIASLQGQTAAAKLPPEVISKLSSVVLRDTEGELYFKSSAIFKLARILGGFWLLLLPFALLPRFFTNWVYDFVAISRYSLFGKTHSCRLPTEEEQAYFLD
jgi:predicted DCC family thiol-disulfide oxidoreductase YuxK